MGDNNNRKVRRYDYYTRVDFVDDVHKITGYTKKDINVVMNAVYQVIEDNIYNAVDMDLGVFYVTNFVTKGGYEKKNVLTGETIIMPERRTIRMKLKVQTKKIVKKTNIDKVQSKKILEKSDDIDK